LQIVVEALWVETPRLHRCDELIGSVKPLPASRHLQPFV
jgi:hypothetical protein